MYRALPAVLLAITLAGCATAGPPVEDPVAARLERVERDVAALRARMDALQPGMERLLGIEGDIRVLLERLSTVPGAAPPATVPPVIVPPVIAPPAAADPLDPMRGADAHALHLASYRERQQVDDGWRRLVARFPDLLGGLAPRVVGIDFGDGRGTFYRLKAGPLPDAAAAEAACRRIRSGGEFCDATDFSGTPGEEFWGRS